MAVQVRDNPWPSFQRASAIRKNYIDTHFEVNLGLKVRSIQAACLQLLHQKLSRRFKSWRSQQVSVSSRENDDEEVMELLRAAPPHIGPRLRGDITSDNARQLIHWHDYISNEIPTRMIDVRTMTLVGREDVTRYYQSLNYAEVSERFNRGWVRARPKADVIRYAILSHRWFSEGEPTYQQMMTKTRKENTGIFPSEEILPSEPGYQKLVAFCQRAIEFDCPFAWSDTCCIDKTSSAELDEAIRSMFRWYRNSTICIVYLSTTMTLEELKLGRDVWFTRGWTLQELLAPPHIKLYSRTWEDLLPEYRNDKWCLQLTGALSDVTGISRDDIENFNPQTDRVAEKIRWTAGRTTTKQEDMTYSLLGIFDVSLIVQYGEGRNAFPRLLEAILQRYSGYDILMWCGRSSSISTGIPAFSDCYLSNNGQQYLSIYRRGDNAMSLSVKGLRVRVLAIQMEWRRAESDRYIVLRDPNRVLAPLSVELVEPCINFTQFFIGILDYRRGSSASFNVHWAGYHTYIWDETSACIEPGEHMGFVFKPDYPSPTDGESCRKLQVDTTHVVKVQCLKELEGVLTTVYM